MFGVLDILDIAIQIERNGEATYRQAADAAGQPLAALLRYLADQEEEHLRSFEKLAAELATIEVNPELAEMGRALLRDVVGDQTFSLDADALTGAKNLAEVLEAAVELESDTITFYQMLADFVTDPAGTARLAEIIAEEQSHEACLRRFLDKGTVPTTEELARGLVTIGTPG